MKDKKVLRNRIFVPETLRKKMKESWTYCQNPKIQEKAFTI
jgi:hypothetical protein